MSATTVTVMDLGREVEVTLLRRTVYRTREGRYDDRHYPDRDHFVEVFDIELDGQRCQASTTWVGETNQSYDVACVGEDGDVPIDPQWVELYSEESA